MEEQLKTNRVGRELFEVDAKTVGLVDDELVAKSIDGKKLFRQVNSGASIIMAHTQYLRAGSDSDKTLMIEILDITNRAHKGDMSALAQYRNLVESSLEYIKKLHPEYENCVLGVDVSIDRSDRRGKKKYHHRDIGIWEQITKPLTEQEIKETRDAVKEEQRKVLNQFEKTFTNEKGVLSYLMERNTRLSLQLIMLNWVLGEDDTNFLQKELDVLRSRHRTEKENKKIFEVYTSNERI